MRERDSEALHEAFNEMLYEQAQLDSQAVEASEYHDRMRSWGYDIDIEDAAAYALVGESFIDDTAFDIAIERVANLALILTRARHDQT